MASGHSEICVWRLSLLRDLSALMFHWNEAGIFLKLVSAVMSTDFSVFLYTYQDCFAISRLSDLPWDLEAKPWDHELAFQTMGLTIKLWEFEGLRIIGCFSAGKLMLIAGYFPAFWLLSTFLHDWSKVLNFSTLRHVKFAAHQWFAMPYIIQSESLKAFYYRLKVRVGCITLEWKNHIHIPLYLFSSIFDFLVIISISETTAPSGFWIFTNGGFFITRVFQSYKMAAMSKSLIKIPTLRTDLTMQSNSFG